MLIHHKEHAGHPVTPGCFNYPVSGPSQVALYCLNDNLERIIIPSKSDYLAIKRCSALFFQKQILKTKANDVETKQGLELNFSWKVLLCLLRVNTSFCTVTGEIRNKVQDCGSTPHAWTAPQKKPASKMSHLKTPPHTDLSALMSILPDDAAWSTFWSNGKPVRKENELINHWLI